MKTVLVMREHDNVGTALHDIAAQESFVYTLAQVQHHCVAVENIPFGFKVALRDMVAGENIVKYQHNIGRATVPIMAGSCVHIHNIEGMRGRGDWDESKGDRA